MLEVPLLHHSRLYLLFLLLVSSLPALAGSQAPAAASTELPPIGVIQGSGDVSPFVDQVVSFRGVVTGFYESRNQEGVTYFTFFVQDPPAMEDGDPATSDGIAVFHGRRRPNLALGDLVRVTGMVVEYYGLTEISDRNLEIIIEARNQPLPEAVELRPPAANDALAAYYEPLEGMRVKVPGAAAVVGPTYSSCGFAVARQDSGVTRIVRRREEDPVGLAILVLHHSNADCAGFPNVAVGDQVAGLVGPLIYHFDQYKLVHQEPAALQVTAFPRPPIPAPPAVGSGQLSVASFNVENLFDLIDDTGSSAEPKPTAAELAVKQTKLAYALSQVLRCPHLVGIQEVEKASLLFDLADRTAAACDFTYNVTHLESPDVRGIDVALLSHPQRVQVVGAQLHQVCTPLETGIVDPGISCPAGQQPLSSRPPLQVDVVVDGHPLALFINHFKSKRGEAEESAPQRLAQAELIRQLAGSLLEQDQTAAIIVMGDFNDYEESPALRLMTADGRLTNVLGWVPEAERYSFTFGGASQLIDGVLLSPALRDRVAAVTIIHNSADYPASLATDLGPAAIGYRASDHDIPFLLLQWPGEATEGDATAQARPGWLVAALVLFTGFFLGGGTALLFRRQRPQAMT
jgi:uncharacterized protein